MRRIRPLLRASAILLAVLVAAGVLLALYLRLDKSHVFLAVRGRYQGVEVLESWATEGSEVRRLALRNHRGETPLEALVRRPRELAADYKIVIVYAGVKTRLKILELIPERPDVVLVAPQYPIVGAKGLWQSLQVPANVRQAAFRTVAGGMLATSFLADSEGLDLDRTTVLGSSIGTAFATLHGALDPRVPRVVLVHGSGDFPAILRYMERNRGRRWRGEAKALLAAVVVDTFDPVHWIGRIAPRELIMIAARDDTYFPTAATLDLYARAGDPKCLIWTDTEHVRSRASATVEQILELVDQRLAGRPSPCDLPASGPAA